MKSLYDLPDRKALNHFITIQAELCYPLTKNDDLLIGGRQLREEMENLPFQTMYLFVLSLIRRSIVRSSNRRLSAATGFAQLREGPRLQDDMVLPEL